jgi:hypothetical protein
MSACCLAPDITPAFKDFLVVDAVPPNWSPWAKFPAYREKNREFIEFRPNRRKSSSKTFNKSALCPDIP